MKSIKLTKFCHASAVTLAAMAFAAVFTANAQAATCEGAELIKPGKLVVAYNGDMPGTGTKDGKLIGIDGSMMNWVAEQLGLEVEPALMEWAAEIESVKARRVDIMHGMMGWNKQRTEVIAISDPIYYAGALMTQKKGSGITTLDQLKDKRIATIQGFGWIPDLKSINTDLQLYDTSDAAVRDLVAGRIDVLFADPPLIQWVQTQNPDWALESVPVNLPYDEKIPNITGKYMIVFGMSKEAPKLAACINAAIAELWKTCGNLTTASASGFADKFWFEPPAENPRIGVDREEGWQLPALGACPS
ncbi:MAG: amino acid ABC transporter substrate-binding protein [Rhizobiales bacterium]|nr:amino acid ABC transporter substrate-binding protein [Hyphomicrobiales bacterium]